jgi:hypothetical protein
MVPDSRPNWPEMVAQMAIRVDFRCRPNIGISGNKALRCALGTLGGFPGSQYLVKVENEPHHGRGLNMRYGILLMAVLMLSSCTQELGVKNVTTRQGTLSTDRFAYVSMPRDGQYGATNYHGTGRFTAQTVAGAFSRYLKKTETAVRVEETGAALARARELGADYLVMPLILHWEDRATQWSGKRDKIGVITGKSTWWTFGGDHPEDMLSEPVNEFVGTLF